MTHHIPELQQIIQRALDEDIQTGDITTNSTVPANMRAKGQFIAKAPGIIAGLTVVQLTFAQIDPEIRVTPHVQEGDPVQTGDLIATVEGNGRAILTGERTALNFLQRMSGIATLTRQFVDRIRHTPAKILDTRKTAPGLRLLDKWAVQLGGGHNHRMGLFDMVMIKDNHITAAGGITAAVHRVREHYHQKFKIEVEVKNLEELHEALSLHVDQIMLDNMSLDTMRQAVQIVNGRVLLEASGNVHLNTVQAIAETGVDLISVGALTHSVNALDISLLLDVNPCVS
ncbi:MAG: carboxylating nicotinate-nucleotide diphosphorylase [Gemmatimonadetes bacterium]|nr:MAG: carboxylating nicotinate-nucleotide diphosphorylase [Gemmatimonadota bacterium]